MPSEDLPERRPRPHRHRLAARVLAGGLIAWTLAAPSLSASGPQPAGAAASGQIRLVSVGFAGRIKPGAWAPVWAEVAAPPGGIDGSVIVESMPSSGGAVVGFAAPVRAGPGARVQVFILAVFYDARAPGMVHLEDGGRRVASLAIPGLRPVEGVIAALSTDPLALDLSAVQAEGLELVYLAPELLPPVWHAYEAVRLLLVRDLDERRIDDPRRSALLHWVWAGGQVAAAPSGDATAHLRGPTIGPLLSLSEAGRTGRGRVGLIPGDPANAASDREGDRWLQSAMAFRPAPPVQDLGDAVGPDLTMSAATQLWVAALLGAYLVAVRRLSRVVGRLLPVSIAVLALFVAATSFGAHWASGAARRDAEGAVAAAVTEAIPGTDHGLLTFAARTVSREREEYRLTTVSSLPLRPWPPAPVLVMHGDQTVILGRNTGVRLRGTAVIPAAVRGTRDAQTGAVTVANRSGRRIEQVWVYHAGRVQNGPDVAATAHFVLDEGRWRPLARLRRADVADAQLLWAFSRLEADDILKGSSAWMVGLWRDPLAAVRRDGRAEPSRSVLIVPLVAP